jgi:hypothetical protein
VVDYAKYTIVVEAPMISKTNKREIFKMCKLIRLIWLFSTTVELIIIDRLLMRLGIVK